MSFYYRRKLRKIGKTLLEASERVELYRGDILTSEALDEQRALTEKVREVYKNRKLGVEHIEEALNNLDKALIANGGKIYPLTSARDFTEMIVMAAIVAGSIRSFFLQPFKIPTNSMWPTYNGLTAEVRAPEEPVPNFALQAIQKLQWTFTYAIPANATGEVGIPIDVKYRENGKEYEIKKHQRIIDDGIFGTRIWKSAVDRYEIYIDSKVQTLDVPLDFNLTTVLLETYFPEEAKLQLREQDRARWYAVFKKAESEGRIQKHEHGMVLLTGKKIVQGKMLLNFDIHTGDMLFVDRMSYNFVNPARGDTFVFRTNTIPGLNDDFGQPSQNYYVKRLAGLPGQRLRVGDNGELFVDGKVVTSPLPMVLNSKQAMDQGYYGYLPEVGNKRYAIPLNNEHTVSPGYYFALGDNSANSYDSRGWGEVPADAVVGKPIFILHPFTNRWGPAK